MPKRPHIVIFNPDQWRGDALGHMGHPAVSTPVLDGLVASEAVSFRNAFVQATVCTPSRCSFMTGWYPHVRGHRTMHHMLNPGTGETNLLKVLKENGYFVWWGGKNDLVPGQLGFEDHCDVHFRPTPGDYRRWGVRRREGNHGGDLAWRGPPDGDNHFSFFKGRLDAAGERVYCDGDWSMVYGAIDFLRQREDSEQPLCLFLPLGYPHPPYCVEEPWYSLTDRSSVPPRHLYETWDDKPALLAGIRDGQGLTGWTEDRWRELRATYYGMCARVDHQLGLLIDALREAGLYDDTALFVFSDHGDFTGDYGLVEKTQNTFQDALSRVPFVVKPPSGASTPGIREQMVELVDFPATVYDMADIDCGYWHFGQSLANVLTDPGAGHRDAVFCEGGRLQDEAHASERESVSSASSLGLYSPRVNLQVQEDRPLRHTKATMCRDSRFKYVRRAYETDELYDLADDPGETRNLVADPRYAPELARLRDRMLTWYMETSDVVPLTPDQRNFAR